MSAAQATSERLVHFNPIMKKYGVHKVVVAKVSRKFDLVDNLPFLEFTSRAPGHDDFEETIIDIIKISPDTDLNESNEFRKAKDN